jgi:ubiquinol-cytochrome c reductase core subunit 2
MLRATRLVRSSNRGFATVVDASAGFKVAAVENAQPTSSVTVLLKAGSRYESKPGVAHVLSNFTFKVRASSLRRCCRESGRQDYAPQASASPL